MGFFTDIGMCWALGSVFWILLKIFAYAYITLWRFFRYVFNLRGAIHYWLAKSLFAIFRIPHVYSRDDIESKISVKSVSIITQSPVRAFLFTFAPLLTGTMLVYVIRMYLGDGTTERLILLITLIILLLIVIVPSTTEMKFFTRTVFKYPLQTVKDLLILGVVITVYVWEFEWISLLPIFGTYLFEFGLLIVGFFAVEVLLWISKNLFCWITAGITHTRQVHPKPLNPPKSVLKARKKLMYPGRKALREERESVSQEGDPN